MWMLQEVVLILILILSCTMIVVVVGWWDSQLGWRNIWVGFWRVSGILATPIYIPYTPSVSRLTPLKVPLTHLKGAIFAQMC